MSFKRTLKYQAGNIFKENDISKTFGKFAVKPVQLLVVPHTKLHTVIITYLKIFE